MMNSDNQEENVNYFAVVQSDKENDNIEEEDNLNEEDYENANSTPIENDHETIKEVDDFEKENSDAVDNLPMGRSRFQNSKLQQEKRGLETNPALQTRRSSQVEVQLKIIFSSSELSFEPFLQDIFERIDNYRGGEGEVKLKDLVLFLRGVYDTIDDNFEVDSVNSTILSTHIVHEKS